jgi:hypothetical protein
MPARRKTPGTKGAAERGRPKSGPTGANRAWLEDQVLYHAHIQSPAGFDRGTPEEFAAVGKILRELGKDPHALLLDMAVAALHERCMGNKSKAGRKRDDEERRRQATGVRRFRLLVAIARAAEKTRGLQKADRLEEMAHAAAREIAFQVDAACMEGIGGWVRSPQLDAQVVVGARCWLESHDAIVSALFQGYPSGRRLLSGAFATNAEEVAATLMTRLSPSELEGFSPRTAEKMRDLERVVANRSTAERKRARVVDTLLSHE